LRPHGFLVVVSVQKLRKWEQRDELDLYRYARYLQGADILAKYGVSVIGCPAYLIAILYSPGRVGTYVIVHVPSLLSLHCISAFDGPSIDRPRPPVLHIQPIHSSSKYVSK